MDHEPPALSLHGDHLRQIEAQARQALPREACGLLVGARKHAVLRVDEIIAAPNVAAGNDRFEIDPAVLARTYRSLRGTARAVLGHYHSHPNGRAELSAADRAAAFTPGLAWLIIAIAPDATVSERTAYLHMGGATDGSIFEPLRLLTRGT